jgi:hypothetical protein
MKHTSGWPGAIAFITMIAAVSLAAAGDTMYRWVDPDGNIYYSDLPPPANARNAESLRQGMPISESDPESASESASYAEKEVEFQERRKQRAEGEAEANKNAETVALSKKNCDQAQADLQTVTNPPGGRLRELNSEGVLVYMTEEQIALRRAEANDAVLKWCKS